VPVAVNTRSVYDGLAALYLPIAAAVFLAVLVAMAWVVRRRPDAQARSDNRRLEIGYACFLTLVAAGLIVATFRAVDHENARAAGRVEVVRAVAGKWHWRFEHASGRVETDVLTVPAGVEVEFRGTSVDVIHAFWVPAAKFQRQLIPGQLTTFRLTFPRPGFATSGACSFFCGLQHARMRFLIDVRAPADYERWAAT
jgi:cytochrome c oxidase subunit 2